MGDRRLSPPNYTQVPNELLDEVFDKIETVGELKVTLAIVRQTFGFHRGERLMSLGELCGLTGLSRSTAQRGIDAALERGYVARRPENPNDPQTSFLYGIRIESKPVAKRNRSPVAKRNRSPYRGKKDLPSVGKKPPTPKGEESQKPLDDSLDPNALFDAAVEEIFEGWRTGTGRNGASKLTPARRKKVTTRLQEAVTGSDEPDEVARIGVGKGELLEAVAGMVNSDWHKREGHQEFDQLFRDRGCIEKFITRHRKHQADAGSSAADRYADYDKKVDEENGGNGGS